jgi:hypothetical protein
MIEEHMLRRLIEWALLRELRNKGVALMAPEQKDGWTISDPGRQLLDVKTYRAENVEIGDLADAVVEDLLPCLHSLSLTSTLAAPTTRTSHPKASQSPRSSRRSKVKARSLGSLPFSSD